MALHDLHQYQSLYSNYHKRYILVIIALLFSTSHSKDDFVICERSCTCMFTYLDIHNIAAEATILRRARQMEAAVPEGCILLMDIAYSPQHQNVVLNVISI